VHHRFRSRLNIRHVQAAGICSVRSGMSHTKAAMVGLTQPGQADPRRAYERIDVPIAALVPGQCFG
jgi:hypothetical protein